MRPRNPSPRGSAATPFIWVGLLSLNVTAQPNQSARAGGSELPSDLTRFDVEIEGEGTVEVIDTIDGALMAAVERGEPVEYWIDADGKEPAEPWHVRAAELITRGAFSTASRTAQTVALVESGLTHTAAADRLGVTPSTVSGALRTAADKQRRAEWQAKHPIDV